jgi:hypothetical protein
VAANPVLGRDADQTKSFVDIAGRDGGAAQRELARGAVFQRGARRLEPFEGLRVLALVEQGLAEREIGGGEALVEGDGPLVGVDGLRRVSQCLIRLSDDEL